MIKWSVSHHSHFAVPPLITAFVMRDVRRLGQYFPSVLRTELQGPDSINGTLLNVIPACTKIET